MALQVPLESRCMDQAWRMVAALQLPSEPRIKYCTNTSIKINLIRTTILVLAIRNGYGSRVGSPGVASLQVPSERRCTEQARWTVVALQAPSERRWMEQDCRRTVAALQLLSEPNPVHDPDFNRIAGERSPPYAASTILILKFR
uniref:(northern house mosquito) hypothetical protein n=1 Tax=Culex pipiens TaxID=7175 RepID=A0A8D8I325_CULPI